MTGFVFYLLILLDEHFFFFRISGYMLFLILVEYSSDDIVEWRLFKIYTYLNEKMISLHYDKWILFCFTFV